MRCSARSAASPRRDSSAACILLEDLFDKIKERYTRHALGMLLVGILMYALLQRFGHYYVEGVGYATVQAILLGQLSAAGLLFLLFVCKLLATSLSLGSGSSGGIFSPSLFMGATIGGAFAAALSSLHLPLAIDIPSFAMVGMGAMVGGGTGAVMTAVTMIFEMTRDYDIVLPMILAVAMSVGVRRLLSRENIYTLKLFRRGHVIPKALHANMFLVRRAKEVMDTDVVLAPAEMTLRRLPRTAGARRPHAPRRRHRRQSHPGRAARQYGAAGRVGGHAAGVTLRDIASRDFTIVREDDIVFDVIQRMWRKRATMALVVRGRGVPRAGECRRRDHQGACRRFRRQQHQGLSRLVNCPFFNHALGINSSNRRSLMMLVTAAPQWHCR